MRLLDVSALFNQLTWELTQLPFVQASVSVSVSTGQLPVADISSLPRQFEIAVPEFYNYGRARFLVINNQIKHSRHI